MSQIPKNPRTSQTLEEIITFLLETVLFEKLNERELAELVRIMQIRNYPENRVVFREGDEGDAWYVVFEGEVEVTREVGMPAPRQIAVLGPHACFGEMAIIDAQLRSATVTTRTECVIFRFPRDDFETLLDEENHGAFKLIREFAKILSERQRHQNDQLF